jgi:hypothetical protein
MWTSAAIIEQESFAGGSANLMKTNGIWHRRLNLAKIGSWQTCWMVAIISFEVPRPNFGTPGAGTFQTWSDNMQFHMGLGSSLGTLPNANTGSAGEFETRNGTQWIGLTGSLSGNPALGQDSVTGSEYWIRQTCWAAARVNSVSYTVTGGQNNYFSLQVPSRRRPIGFILIKGSPWKIGIFYPNVFNSPADYTKADAISWLASYSTTADFRTNRPTGVYDAGTGANIVDMQEATYGDLDTFYFGQGKGNVDCKLHAIYGRMHTGVV